MVNGQTQSVVATELGMPGYVITGQNGMQLNSLHIYNSLRPGDREVKDTFRSSSQTATCLSITAHTLEASRCHFQR